MLVDGSRSIVEVVAHWAATRPAERACAFLSDGETLSAELTYLGLHLRARAVAAALYSAGARGLPTLVLCPAGLDYVQSLLGCFYAGAIAVPAYPPTRTGLARTMPRIRAICSDCQPRVVLTTHAVRELLVTDAALREALGSAQIIAVDALTASDHNPELTCTVAPDAPALLQYTSGSTSAPKGVLVTHAQLAANAAIIAHSSGLDRADRVLSWLPPYHDMGLVGGILEPLFVGAESLLMPPDVFLRRPARWLATATRLRATALLAPNFALDACVRRITADDRASYDLSAVRVVYVGAEPIRAQTLDRFAEAFAACGFRREAFFPCYGMAEATLMISGGDASAPPVVRSYAGAALDEQRAEPAARGDGARRLVGCGRAVLDARICIVEPTRCEPLGERRIGEIWVQSPGVAAGYWRRADETERVFRAYTAAIEGAPATGPWLRTGDLGFLDGGELFITGRLKDLIIVRGRNHFPQDIELTVQALDDALVLDAGAAFSIDAGRGEELVVVQEVDKRTGVDPQRLLVRIPDAIREAHDITPAAVVLIKRGTLSKTSSGKVQRRATRDVFQAGTLDVVAQIDLRAQQPIDPPGERTATEPAATASRTSVTLSRRALEIEGWLRARVAQKLGIAAEDIDPRQTVGRYGVDSALAAEIVEDLQQWLGIRLDTTISYDHPTVAGLARAVAAMHAGQDPHASAQSARPPRSRAAPRSKGASAHPEREPIAIVGMACRFPGAPDVASFWRLLDAGGDAIEEVPRERWNAAALYAPEPGTPGKMCSKWGGFIDDIERFDASFFEISPHEAARMDPQQRLFLEVAWEALEDAGIAPSSLAGTRSAVFAGVCTSDFALLHAGDLKLADGDYGTGRAPGLVANRISYLLDLKGPSETLDSACSSSLAALHHACQSLESGDCDLAIVGGVNAVLAPEVSISFSQIGALARDGRCKTLDTNADGFVRSEGAGVLVLKPLSAAERDGDRVYALVSGTAINHDGRSQGLSAPNGIAQRAVIERALSRAGIAATDLDYVELHGVGTKVADAVEVAALGKLLESGSIEHRLRIGSAKTNVGHLEAASGMVSVIKLALALGHEQLPAQLHCRSPIESLATLPLDVVTENTAWPRGARPRYAGASAFGFGGSNAHVVLREAPLLRSAPLPKRSDARLPPQLVTLSARTPAALSASVRRLADHLEQAPELALESVALTLNTGRSAFRERAAILATDIEDLRETLLSMILSASTPATVARGSVKPSSRLRVALVLADATLHPNALLELRGALDGLFAPALDQADRALRALLDRPWLDALCGGSEAERAALLARPSYAHPATVAVAHALSTLLSALSLEPDVVYGSGAGEHAAAALAGCLPWDHVIAMAARRGLLLEGLEPGAEQRLTLREAKIGLEPLDAVATASRIPFVSGLLGRTLALDEVPGSAHWSKHLLASVDPRAGLRALRAEACDAHLELTAGVDRAEALHGAHALLSGANAMDALLRCIGALFVRGAELDLRVLTGAGARKVSLPTYPFERERHWIDRDRSLVSETNELAPSASGAPPLTERPISHPIIGRVRSSRPANGSGFIHKGTSSIPAPKDRDKAGSE